MACDVLSVPDYEYGYGYEGYPDYRGGYSDDYYGDYYGYDDYGDYYGGGYGAAPRARGRGGPPPPPPVGDSLFQFLWS